MDPLVERRLLWGILFAALLLRLWGIGYGLPHVYWTDEYHEVMRAMELGAGGFNLERTGKGGFYFLLFLEYGVHFAWLKATGAVDSTREFAELFVSDPTSFYLMGRATAAVFGSATVAAAYLLGRRAFGGSVGICAALFLAVNLLHVDLSHRVGVDVPMALFATLALCYAVRIADGGTRRDYLLAGVFTGLATTTKLPAILLLLPLVVAHTYGVGRDGWSVRRWLFAADAWMALALFVVVWVASNPGILFAGNILSLYAGPDAGAAEDLVEVGDRPNLWTYYAGVVRSSMGWPIFLLSLVGVGFALRKRRPADVVLLAYGGVNYVAIASTTSENLYFPRYTLPIVVVLSVFAARSVIAICEHARGWRLQATVLTATLASAWPLVQSMQFSHSLTQTDTRSEAREWFEENVPAGEKVLVEGGRIAVSRLTVQLEESRDSLDRRIAYWRAKEPRQARFLEIKRSAHRGGGYDLELVRLDSVLPLGEYVAKGVHLFVVRPDSFLGSRKSGSESAALVEALRTDPRVRLVASFDAGEELRQGPRIEIYRLERAASRDE